MDGLGVRLRYRNYGYKDKSARFLITGDTSASPDRSWSAANPPTAEEPYGHATANRTDSSTGRFDAQLSYDLGDLTLEGAYRNLQSEWVGRANSSGTDGTENAYTLAAVYRTGEWVDFRFSFDQAKRTVDGIVPGSVGALQGVMADHAEREQTRIGLEVDLARWNKFGVGFAYYRRNDDYPNRPFEVPGDSSTESGLLEATYDEFSVDFEFMPSERAELAAFYTYEKVEETNQWVTLTSGALNNLLRYAPWDKGNTFGVNGRFQIVPEKWTASVLAQYQKVDGFLDITAREAGSFYTPGRTTLIPPGQGGAADISDYDDTEQTTVILDLAYNVAKSWALSVGYAYEKYSFADAFSDGTNIFPQSVLFFLKGNDGGYEVNVGYTKLTYRF
jgi:predicted porin